MKPLSIAVACGGTGGHIFPGLATANVLRARGHAVEVWLSGRDIESRALESWDGPVFHTGARPLVRSQLGRLPGSVARCWLRMGASRPDALLAMGSYASVPPGWAARLRRVPIVLHEANAVAGKATDHFAPSAAAIAWSFGAPPARYGAKGVRTGLPVRTELAGRPPLPGFEPDGDAFTLFVTGGSQGCRFLNETVPAACMLLAAQRGARLRVIHQTGAADETAVRTHYASGGIPALVSAFIDDMGGAFAAAEAVVCRAGAATCAELALCGKPALLVPLPSAVRDHQRLNARSFAEAGAALCLEQSSLAPEALAGHLADLRDNPARRQSMRSAMKSFAAPDAADRLADVVEKVARGDGP
ncbi:MAG: UDP-N-acetylglucosamine--N-acetylmuramyl-(pentapeptide) pyrophosphoryl-undecaprenol N-acetylglucosamine transferase [Kiritimatiellia bacterium]|jgi:UDP-N-acetylglucosamine--N-acetylmuramyl-(pentapeptide) pyrophosphoryl-undecaprenol N-acetylglucosamine transferase